MSAVTTATPSEDGSASPLPDPNRYDLTIGEAAELFVSLGRKRPSERSIQRYCQASAFDCLKLRTTRDGVPITEWIINNATLRKFIETKPPDDTVPPVATPEDIGGATDRTAMTGPSRVELMIENARLLAKFEASEQARAKADTMNDRLFTIVESQFDQSNTTIERLQRMHGETMDALKAAALSGTTTTIEQGESSKQISAKVINHD